MKTRIARDARRGCARWIASAAAATAFAFWPALARAATVSWNTNLSGAWDNLVWTGGVGSNPPTASDIAAFNFLATYNISFVANTSVAGVSVGGSNVTFLNVFSGITFSNSGALNVSSGSFSLGATVPITWTNTGAINFNANATVSLGNDMSGASLAVGNSGAATATFTGSGTTLNITSGVGVGNGNTGTLTFSNSAIATTAGALNVSSTGVGQGNFNVQSGASLNHTGAITIGANAFNSASMTVNSASVVAGGGTLTVNSTGVLNIQSGGTFTLNNQAINVGSSSGTGTQGKIVVGGMGASFMQNGAAGLTVGFFTGSAATIQTTTGGSFSTGTGGMTIDATGLVDVAGGTFSLNSNATVIGTLQRSAIGTFDWASGKTMSLQNGGDFLISGGYSLPNSAGVTVTGMGSSLSQSGNGALTVSGGSSLTIATGATVTTLAEHISDGSAGTVTQTGGTYNVGNTSLALILANSAGGTGTYNLSGGDLTVTNDVAGLPAEAIGYLGTGNFVQTGGSHTVNGANGNLAIGYGATGVGTYTASNGGVVCSSLYIGHGGTGTLTLNNNGYAQVDTSIEFGRFAGVTGTANVNSGGFLGGQTMYVGGTSSSAGGTGVVNINAGDVQISGETRIWNTTGSTINLSSGTFYTGSLNTSGNPSRFNWTGGNLRITGVGPFDTSAAGTTLTLTNGKGLFVTNTTNIPAGASVAGVGSFFFITGSLSGAGALSSDGNFIITGNDNTSTTFTGTITGPGGLSKNGTGTFAVRNTRIDNLAIHGGRVAVIQSGGATTGTSIVTALSTDSGGKLDLTDNKLIVTSGTLGAWNGSNYDGITGMIKAGRNGGSWNGTGIVTSMPAAVSPNILTTLAVATAGNVGKTTFGGQSVSPSDVLVMYTYTGDANLSGRIDADDYFQIDSHYNKTANSAKSYFNGDFNYDGQINGDDYFLIDNAFVGQGAPFSNTSLSGVSIVPEPAGGALFLAIAALYASRRCRSRCSA